MQNSKNDLKSKFDEQKLTEVLYHLTEERLLDGNISQDAVKRSMRLKEVQEDIKKELSEGREFTPTDFIRAYGLFILFVAEHSGLVSFPYQDVFQWVEFKKMFYQLTSVFDETFDFKKSKGRPSKSETSLLYILGAFCRNHNLPTCDHRYKCSCNYISLFTDILEIRLARSEEWHKRDKGGYEWIKVFSREFKATKTMVDRFWKEFYNRRPTKLYAQDKQTIVELLCISVPSLRRFRPKLLSALVP